MTGDPQHRTTTTPPPDQTELRQSDDTDADGMMSIRLPIASTGDVRNEGDDPLSFEELRGMAQQIDSRELGVFPEHGQSDVVDFAGYSQFEKMGYWESAEIERDAAADDSDLLFATARMPDPESLPAATGTYRQALAILKEQALRGVPITTSIGWREDENAPGGNDLLEVSIVGIAADPRTGTEGGEALLARAAIEAGADKDEFLETVRDAVEGERPLGPPEDPERFDSFEECVDALAEDPDLSREDAEEICGAWEQAKNSTDDDNEMSEQDAPDDSGTDSTDEEQTNEQSDGGDDTQERAPSDIELLDWAELLASHIEGVDSADLMDAWDPFAEDYVGEVDLNELASFVADVTDTDTGDAQEALDRLMDDEDEDEEEEEEEENDYDDEDSDDGRDAEDSELVERVAELEDELAAVRSGDVDIQRPDSDADGGESDGERDADDGEEERETNNNEDDSTLRDEWLSIEQ